MTLASYEPRESKMDEQGKRVILYRNVSDGSWFVGRVGDRALDPVPLGGFSSAEAARRWADAQFHDGAWQPERGPRHHV